MTSLTTNLRSCLPGILLLLSLSGPAQVSVHREQSLSHAGFAEIQDESRAPVKTDDSCRLNSMVFGYHPYWVGNVWQNYRWNLLSDLCYFSYEVDPSTGNALSTNSWETNPVIDTALSHGTRVHLCITLFGSHSAFFNNAQARQNLINNTIDLLSQRGASGVNLDFEAVPGSLAEAYNSYIAAFADSLHAALPGTLVSIASPAVDWDGLLDIPLLSEHLDFFMIMGYDYYRNGSSVAGPVSGLYPMTGDYPYSVSRTLAWYLSEGAPAQKLVLGLPYYGRTWPVENQLAPSSTTGSGTALTYRAVRKDTYTYSPSRLMLEPNSLSPYYSFKIDGWNHCFIDNVRSLGDKYELAIRSGIAGTGIWALGYDNGYTELWDLIRDKFSDCSSPLCSDTLYDSGGGAFDYFTGEDWWQTVRIEESQELQLEFLEFGLANGDTLWVFDGKPSDNVLLGSFTGTLLPPLLQPSHNSFSLHFKSGNSRAEGWKAVYRCPSAGMKIMADNADLKVFPNPCRGAFVVQLGSLSGNEGTLSVSDLSGRQAVRDVHFRIVNGKAVIDSRESEIRLAKAGVYIGSIHTDGTGQRSFRIINLGE